MRRMSGLSFRSVSAGTLGSSQDGRRVLWTPRGSLAVLVASMMVKHEPRRPRSMACLTRQTAVLCR